MTWILRIALSTVFVCVFSAAVDAATCEDTDASRPKDLADFCAAMKLVDTYLLTYAAQNPGKSLPPEASQKLGAFVPANLGRASEFDGKALLIGVAQELVKLVNGAQPPVLNDSPVRTALGALRAALNAMLYQVTPSEADLRLDLISKIAVEQAAPTVFAGTATVAKVKQVITALVATLPVDAAFLDDIKARATALTERVSQGAGLLIQDGSAAAPKAVPDLKKLRAAIDSITVALTPRIHIYYAYFGDLDSEGKVGRICDATATMRGRCEASARCKLPDSFETTLCGYNPVPFIEAKDRGAVVSYDCQIGGEDLWTRNVVLPRGNFMAPDLPTPVVLQSTQMEIACARTP